MPAEKWATPANKAVRISLVSHDGEQAFQPDYTYPIYGESETIYGYSSDLSISLKLASGSLAPLLDVSYKAKNDAAPTTVDDVEGKIRDVLPPAEDLLADQAALQAKVVEEAAGAFKPLGELVHSYTRAAQASKSAKSKGKGRARGAGGAPSTTSGPGADEGDDEAPKRVFEIYHSNWDTPGWRDMHRRMQIFTLLFIEGASYIEEDQTAWQFLTLYERVPAVSSAGASSSDAKHAYRFVGYTSLYRFWCYPDAARIRLAQFLVLPPWQHAGHGSELYTHVLDRIIATPDVHELTVEDPSEAFDRVRDGSDLRRLFSAADGFIQRAKAADALRPPINAKWSLEERRKHKIAPRQWARLVEMCQLLQLDQDDEELVLNYRLQVKARIYRAHRDVVKQMEPHERKAKLQETFESVVEEYAGLTGVDVDAMLDGGEEEGESDEVEMGFAMPPKKVARR